ncbi:hypothetical protein ACFORJ_01765 [Corynebacterium hansenii]|uniref:Uncharacterized protein n=1 Tax=Corynebacterium hansenii TaxID=394964 RepID=A0ABV7ZNC5_9CORY|nr:hypothetical protein [Corynebacterium hansenii]WJY99274.1 hypothetical protein CHAN_03230 [Corynebacterium hansenii]
MTLNERPTTDAQWARAVERRLRSLERPRSVTLGPWEISVSPISGDLVADHIPTGRRRVIAAAEPDMKE